MAMPEQCLSSNPHDQLEKQPNYGRCGEGRRERWGSHQINCISHLPYFYWTWCYIKNEFGLGGKELLIIRIAIITTPWYLFCFPLTQHTHTVFLLDGQTNQDPLVGSLLNRPYQSSFFGHEPFFFFFFFSFNYRQVIWWMFCPFSSSSLVPGFNIPNRYEIPLWWCTN